MKLNVSCVVKVGEGRGFIIKNYNDHGPRPTSLPRKYGWCRFLENNLIVTAAHCLPKLPPAHAASFTEERTYPLLGTLDGSIKDVFGECLFVDPIADIAVLGEPSKQEPFYRAEDYQELIADRPTLPFAKARSGRGWVLSLEGHWVRTKLDVCGGSLSIGPTKSGMSGSPILNDAGRAVGVVVVSGQQPLLSRALPGWLLDELWSERLRPAERTKKRKQAGHGSSRLTLR